MEKKKKTFVNSDRWNQQFDQIILNEKLKNKPKKNSQQRDKKMKKKKTRQKKIEDYMKMDM